MYEGRVVYYFGKDIKNAEDYTLNLPIKVEAKSYIADKTIPGFTLASLIFVLMIVFISKRLSKEIRNLICEIRATRFATEY